MAEYTDLSQDPLAPPDGPARPVARSVRIWQAVFVLILLAFVITLAVRLVETNESEQRASGGAPAFTMTAFPDTPYAGETFTLEGLAGKGIVLNFWASWCDPCREEAALLEATWRREKENGIVFIGLDYLDQEPAAMSYLKEFSISYPNGPDLQSQAARRYGIKGVPETFFISPTGEITEIVIGPITSQGQMDAYLDEIRP